VAAHHDEPGLRVVYLLLAPHPAPRLAQRFLGSR
jgi:hypothetical protein